MTPPTPEPPPDLVLAYSARDVEAIAAERVAGAVAAERQRCLAWFDASFDVSDNDEHLDAIKAGIESGLGSGESPT